MALDERLHVPDRRLVFVVEQNDGRSRLVQPDSHTRRAAYHRTKKVS